MTAGLAEVMTNSISANRGLTPDLAWMDPVAAVCAAVPRFTVSFMGPEFFGDAVLYLGVASESLRVLHERLVDSTSPEPALVERYFELDRYVPHLTLGQTVLGMTPSELKDMHYEADQVLRPFPVFEVTSVRIYREVKHRYEPFRDVPLA